MVKMNNLPADYEERVYAGVLGKIIGVYLGRPFEQWTNRKIEDELGEINYYVHEKRGVPLVVSDDDISGTFTFLRALPDHLLSYGISAEQIGKTWLNYLIEKRTILWWGGMGVSTEHTAYMRLKAGIPAPQSGSIALNGPIVAEQIGAQIFIDGWAMVAPGDPERAVALAAKAGSVSHDGEAIYGAQVVAALESLAFNGGDIHDLILQASSYIPRASLIHHLIQDLRDWYDAEPNDWRVTFAKVEHKWGYDNFGGGCHMIPNHAIIIMALLYGENDFQKSLMIANTAGWDTDCNSGNVGCILGIKNGLEGINGSVDFRGPVADRMYLSTADGGRCITDAVRETYEIVNIARAIQGMRPLVTEHGMRFHFRFPGSVQGFEADPSPDSRGTVRIENVPSLGIDSQVAADDRMLAIHYSGVGTGRVARVSTPTFLPPDALKAGGYFMMASPTLYSGQEVHARVLADNENRKSALVRLFIRVYGKDDKLEKISGEAVSLSPGDTHHFHWKVPDTGGRPIAEVGLFVGGHSDEGTIYLDWMGWTGAPDVTLRKPDEPGRVWRRAWVNAVDEFREWGIEPGMSFSVVQNEGNGLAMQGEADWQDYTVTTLARPHLANSFGIVACVRGLRRYVALRLERLGEVGMARLMLQHDDIETELDELAFDWELYQDIPMAITASSDGRIEGYIGNGESAVTLTGEMAAEQARGAVGFYVQTGHVQYGPVTVTPTV